MPVFQVTSRTVQPSGSPKKRSIRLRRWRYAVLRHVVVGFIFTVFAILLLRAGLSILFFILLPVCTSFIWAPTQLSRLLHGTLLPDTLLPEPEAVPAKASPEPRTSIPGPTFDASTLPEQLREDFHRNLRAVEQVRAFAPQTRIAEKEGIPRSTLGRLVRRTKLMGQIACVPRGSYARSTTMHPAFQECIRRLYLLPTQMSMTAIHEHTEMRQIAAHSKRKTRTPVTSQRWAIEQTIWEVVGGERT